MKKIWSRLKADLKEYRISLGLLCAYYIVMRFFFRAFCPMVVMTGLPCPGCGLSRAVWFLITGQPGRSVQIHPLGIFWLLLIVYWAVNRYVYGKRITRLLIFSLVLLTVATVGLYIYRMAVWFPDRPPMSYTGRNMMEKLIPEYRTKVLTYFRLYG